jgi:hypothetical protein
MKLDTHSPEYAKHVIGAHSRGIVCAGEVWIQFVDFFSPETMPVWLESLTPELDQYFRRKASNADFEHCQCERERSALQSIIDWYERHPTV